MLQKTNRKKFITSISVTVFIAATIFLFLPFTIYKGNINEFIIPLTTILTFFLFPALIIASILCAIGLLLPKGPHQRYISILFVIGILIWMQGNILVWKYGLLDGQGIDWTIGTWRGWVDGTLWIVLLVTAYIFYRKIYKIVGFASITILSFQIILLAFTSFQQPVIWKMESEGSHRAPDYVFEFSPKQNVIHIILDAYQSDIFKDIIDDDYDHYYTSLEGFTFFEETTGSFPTTKMSIPAIFSGKVYKNDITMPKFYDYVFKGKTINNILYDSGYEVDIVAHGIRGRYSNNYLIPEPYGVTKQQYKQANSAFMLDLVFFRQTPHFIKKFIYNDQSWFFQRLWNSQSDLSMNRKRSFRYFAHEDFLSDLITKAKVSATRDKPVYKFIHLMTSHVPVVVNEDCLFAGQALPLNRKNLKIQLQCVFDHVIELLNKLKLIGVYESSLIIIHADHGAGRKVNMRNMDINELDGGFVNENLASLAGTFAPLMIIKPPYSKGRLNISSAQTELTDIPATISSILNLADKFEGKSAFEIEPNEKRERKFYNYAWRHKDWQTDYFDHLDEFIINGSVFDRASWHLGLTYFSPELLLQTLKLDFGTESAVRFLRSGWGSNEMNPKEGSTYTWAIGSSASIFLSLPQNEAILLTANVKTIRFEKPQIVTVKVDGRKIGSWEVSPTWNWEKHSIVIPPNAHRAGVSNVEFNFSQHRVPNGEGDPRPLAVLFESITLSKPQ